MALKFFSPQAQEALDLAKRVVGDEGELTVGVLMAAAYKVGAMSGDLPQLSPCLPEPETRRRMVPDVVRVAEDLRPVFKALSHGDSVTVDELMVALLESAAGRDYLIGEGLSVSDFERAGMIARGEALPDAEVAALAATDTGSHWSIAGTFRLFISSTFSDLEEERNALQSRVFPVLQKLCESKGARFQAIDLRWGVSDEAGLDQRTMPLCIDEIARCQKADPPNFLILLGDRYGWRPLPATIPAQEFEMILERVDDEANRRLATWYVRDDNAVPPEYYLKARDPDGPYGTSKDETEKEGKSHAWEEEAAAMRVSLLGAIDGLDLGSERETDAEARSKYLASATEQEIERGAFRVPDAPDHVFCFLRKIEDLPADESAERYRDLIRPEDASEWEADSEADAALQRLRDRLAKYLPGNTVTSTVPWDAATRRPRLDLDRFCSEVEDRLTRAIEARLALDEGADSVTVEADAHLRFAVDRTAFFTGRVNALAAIAAYLADGPDHLMVIHGVSGSGKSALMAQAATQAGEQHRDAAVLVRFIGATAASSGGRGLLGDLCREIGARYEVADPVPDDLQELTEMFPQRLALATAEKPLVIFIDALDQLVAGDAARRLTWLPAELPDHVRVVVSTLPGDTFDATSSHNPEIFEVAPMSLAEANDLLDLWLDDAGRTLQIDQRAEILDKFERAEGLPLYLKLAFEEAQLWRSQGDHPPLAPDVVGVIRDNLFTRLEAPANHGELLVTRALSYLAASRYGLAEDEIVAVLSRDEDVFRSIADLPYHDIPESGDAGQRIPVVVWARLYGDLEPYLTERGADGATTLDFYHRQFRETALESYMHDAEEKRRRHRVLSDLFRAEADPAADATWSGGDIRGLSELPYHLVESEQFDESYEVLTDFHFMERKVAEVGVVQQTDGQKLYTGVSRLREDFDHALARMPGGDETGEHRRIILTAVDLGEGLQIRCPHCNQTWPFDEEWRGDSQDIDCPTQDCKKPLRINPFVVGESPTGRWARV